MYYTDPKESKRQRGREFYARHAYDIWKRRREAHENRQASTADPTAYTNTSDCISW
jgi:hypothetical protein